MFVVRDTNHPQEDVSRNWSTTVGGVNDFGDFAFDSEDEANEADDKEYRFHDAYEGYVPVHYEGLGAFCLDAENLEDAIKEAKEYESDLACTSEKGDGHFMAYEVVSFHRVSEGRFVFELK